METLDETSKHLLLTRMRGPVSRRTRLQVALTSSKTLDTVVHAHTLFRGCIEYRRPGGNPIADHEYHHGCAWTRQFRLMWKITIIPERHLATSSGTRFRVLDTTETHPIRICVCRCVAQQQRFGFRISILYYKA